MSIVVAEITMGVAVGTIRVTRDLEVIREGVEVLTRCVADKSVVWVVMVAIIREGSIAEISEVRVRSVVRCGGIVGRGSLL